MSNIFRRVLRITFLKAFISFNESLRVFIVNKLANIGEIRQKMLLFMLGRISLNNNKIFMFYFPFILAI